MLQLILASQSPRRKSLLEEAGFKPLCLHSELSEIINKNINLEQALELLAQQKVEAVLSKHKLLKKKDILVVGADTCVVMDGCLYGKPESPEQAFQFLSELSGRKHSVMTSVCVSNRDTDELVSFVETSDVEFYELTNKQINDYVSTGEPMDKAGGYAIQGGAKKFVKEYTGSWANIVGFPVERFLTLVDERAWQIDRG